MRYAVPTKNIFFLNLEILNLLLMMRLIKSKYWKIKMLRWKNRKKHDFGVK